jgi:glutathione S-transferase
MIKFYYTPISVNARRVWVALLEKQIPFELVELNLDGDQFKQDFTAVNPLQRIPAIVDNGFRVFESLAILDYLEAKFSVPSLLPTSPQTIALVRMVEMIAINELQPATVLLTRAAVGLETEASKLEIARQRIAKVLQTYESLLGERPYFAGEKFTLAEVVAGTLIPSVTVGSISLEPYQGLKAWLERLNQRTSWHETAPSPEAIEAALPNIKKILERRS